MTMSDERPETHLILPILIRPIIQKIERKDTQTSQMLINAFNKLESTDPSLLVELIFGIVKRSSVLRASHDDLTFNMTESLLRLQGCVPEFEENKSRRPEEPFQELNRKAAMLKKILSRIPDEINDRKTFLETIKEIASAIKKLLDCVNEISNGSSITTLSDKRTLEHRKREFIKDSKKFSQTLKEFFREGQAQTVFQSAAQLIYATIVIQKTVKAKCDPK